VTVVGAEGAGDSAVTGLPWFRVYTDARTDAKLASLKDDEHRTWFRLLAFAAEQEGEARGTVPSRNRPLLAIEVATGNEELLERTLARLQVLEIVRENEAGDCFVFLAFADRNPPSEARDRVAERKRRQRAKERGHNDVTASHGDTAGHHGIDLDLDLEVERSSSREGSKAHAGAATTRTSRAKKPPDPRVKQFLDYYRVALKERRGLDAFLNFAKHGSLVKRWLVVFDADGSSPDIALAVLIGRLDRYLVLNDPFVRDNGWSLDVFGIRLQGLAKKGDAPVDWTKEDGYCGVA